MGPGGPEPLAGFEPAPFSLPRRRSSRWSYRGMYCADRAGVEPASCHDPKSCRPCRQSNRPMEPTFGVEPNRPLYKSEAAAVRAGVVRPAGFEPATSRYSGGPLCRWSTGAWSLCRESNTVLRVTTPPLWPSELQRHGFRDWTRTSVLLLQRQGGIPATHPETVREVGVEPTSTDF